MKKIKIMHILPSLEVGGMENGVVNLVNGLDRKLFKPFICCLDREGVFKDRLRDDVGVFSLQQKEGVQCFLPFVLRKIFHEQQIDIVHTHNFSTALYGVIAAKLAGTPIVIHGEHGMIVQDKKRRKIFAKYFSNFYDCVTTVSNDLREKLVNDIGVQRDKVFSIANGVSLSEFKGNCDKESLRKEFNLQSSDLVIGSVGRLTPVKDHKTLMAAFTEVIKHIPNAKLLLIGDGPLRQDLESMAKNLKLGSNVIFFGNRKDVLKIYNLMDVFVLASLSEGMSNVILEAMSSKLPVVATDVGSNSELIKNGETGILVPAADHIGLSQGIICVLSNIKKANEMGMMGYEYVKEKFTLGAMIKNYEDLYKLWLKRKKVMLD